MAISSAVDAATQAHLDAEYLRVKALAERGGVHAQHSLGFMYFNGPGAPQSFAGDLPW
mgnify:CR=1 FL=1